MVPQSAAAAAATSAVGAINNGAAGGAASVSGASTASAAGVTKTAVSNAAVTFTVPGRHILILPVGLVVFCVITGFMLLVIVYQHFWRMRYRSVSPVVRLPIIHDDLFLPPRHSVSANSRSRALAWVTAAWGRPLLVLVGIQSLTLLKLSGRRNGYISGFHLELLDVVRIHFCLVCMSTLEVILSRRACTLTAWALFHQTIICSPCHLRQAFASSLSYSGALYFAPRHHRPSISELSSTLCAFRRYCPRT